MLNLNDFFHSTNNRNCFDVQIEPLESERLLLVQAKDAIRDFLKSSIRKASVSVLGLPKEVEPKFRTQGSWRYKTCVRPAQNPPQEMDWDLGVYLPLSVWTESGPPSEMARKYFSIVEGDLRILCKEKGWWLETGKKTCSRVRINKSAHIDIPLYAAPEEQFRRLVEAVALNASRKGSYMLEFASLNESIASGEIPDDESWDGLEDQIHMATRDGTWKPSDPEAVYKWFIDRIEEHGGQLRRIARYVKAWRDHQWREGGPTSVALMIAVTQTFRQMPGRDDLAIERAFDTLSRALGKAILEEGIDNGKEDFNRLDAGGRSVAVQLARKAADAMSAVRSLPAYKNDEVRRLLTDQFGPRLDGQSKEDSVDIATHIRNTPARVVATPIVGRTHAG